MSPNKHHQVSFSDLLHWHLVTGTRPAGATKREWTNKEFAGAVRFGITDKAIRNWRTGRNLPRVLEHIEHALFGETPSGQHAVWREELRHAYNATLRGEPPEVRYPPAGTEKLTIRPEVARFGVALGFALGRLELIGGSKFPEAQAAEQPLRSEIQEMLTWEDNDFPLRAYHGDAQTLMKTVINYFSYRDLTKHAAVLIGVGALRLSLSNVSKSSKNNAEMRQLAQSTFMEIDSNVAVDPNALFERIAELDRYVIPEICKTLAVALSH